MFDFKQIDVAAILAESLSDCKFEHDGEFVSPKDALAHNGFLPIISYWARDYAKSLFGIASIFKGVLCVNDVNSITGIRTEIQFESSTDALLYLLVVHDLVRSINAEYGVVSLKALMLHGSNLIWPGGHRKSNKNKETNEPSLAA